MTSPEPGWYADDAGVTRWWDGSRWQDPQPPLAAQPPVPAAPPQPDAVRGRRIPVIALAAVGVVALVAVAFGVWALVGGDGDDSTAGPRDAAQQLVDSVRDADCAAMEAVTSAQYRDEARMDCAALAEAQEWLASIGGEFTVGEVVELSETRAEVTVVLTGDSTDETETTVFTVVLEDGRWLVVDDADGPESSGGVDG